MAEAILNKIRSQVSGKKRNAFPRRLMQLPPEWRSAVRYYFLGMRCPRITMPPNTRCTRRPLLQS